jgi:copper resistance protein B
MKSAKEKKTHNRASSVVAIVMVFAPLMPSASAQDAMPADHTKDAMPGMDGMDMPGMDKTPDTKPVSPPQEETLPALRDPNAYSDGYDFGPIPRPRFADEHNFASLLVDRMEWVHTSNNTATAYDLQAWYGRDYNRAVLKAEGDVDNSKVQEGRAELLWGHAVSPFWDAQLGMRYDHGVSPERSWLAFGVQGLAPYWVESTVTAYVGDEDRTALRLDGEYDLLLTQRLILQPRVEMDFYGKSDAARALGSGLADLAAGVRLRYEIRREFAPYLGFEWAGKYGGTADYARAAGDATKETRLIAGVRFWF